MVKGEATETRRLRAVAKNWETVTGVAKEMRAANVLEMDWDIVRFELRATKRAKKLDIAEDADRVETMRTRRESATARDVVAERLEEMARKPVRTRESAVVMLAVEASVIIRARALAIADVAVMLVDRLANRAMILDSV